MKMRLKAVNCNCAAVQQQQAQQQQQFDNCMRRKSRKKQQKNSCSSSSSSSVPSMLTTTATTRRTSTTCISLNNKFNKTLITITLLLITAAAIICTPATATPLPLPASASASATSTQILPLTALLQTGGAMQQQQLQQQRRLLQQQQLFALLTKNRQQQAAAVATITAADAAAAALENENDDDTANVADVVPPHYYQQHRNVADIDDETLAASLETSGFVADDGQTYEALKGLVAAVVGNTANNSNKNSNDDNNCPPQCKCLNDYFDCGKQHLDRVPTLPNYVQILDLVNNKLNDTSVLQIRNLADLHKLSLKRNQLESMPKFSGLLALKQLNLANNRIQRISSEALAALPKLKALDLSRNYLHTLEANYFPPTNRLAHLILNGNEISNIDEQAFEHLGDLLDLELNGNRLVTLPAGVFQKLNKLKKLSLNYNHLEINWSTFKGLLALQKLFLKSNNIRTLQDGVFHVMRAIETIELDHNGITSLSRQGLFNLTRLQHLSLSNNSISRIELDTWEFTQSLNSLDLSHNNISEFKPQHLDCLQRLRHLNLGHNKIQWLAENTFDCVKNLEDLNLRRNKLAWIIEDQGAAPPFKALRKLKKLDLFGNNLKQINSKSLSGLVSLESLNLGGNTLATVQTGAFDHMSHLQKLSFKSDNFICDCELLWFHRWLAKSAQPSANAVCGYPEHLFDRELLSLTPAELICADTPKPVITQEPSNQLAVKGANITMECIGNSPAAASLAATDELKIKWRHDNQNVRERGERPFLPAATHFNGHTSSSGGGGSYSTTETQIHHDQTTNQTTIIGYLRLYNVSYESAGKYQCVVSNAFGTTYSQKFKISIGIHPTFLQIPSNLTIDSGDTARLVCSATGDPMPEIALQKFGASDFPAATERRLQVIREENAFIITNAKPIDTGIYTCTAESAAGEIKINASLIVNDKPQPAVPLVRKEIPLGGASVLECLSEAAAELNQPHREWYKDHKPFHTSSTSASERYYFTAERELLVIVNTQSMDAGQYRCEITDNARTYTLQTELVVVKEDFSQNVVIVGVVLVTVACVLIGTLIVCTILFYQKRKQLFYSRGGGGLASAGGAAAAGVNGARVHSSNVVLSGSRGSVLDQTQLTTLNRTFLTATPSHRSGSARRPHSLADLEYQLNGGIPRCSYAETRCSPGMLILADTPGCAREHRNARAQLGSPAGLELVGGGGEGFTLQYLQQHGTAGGDGDDDAGVDHTQQDHLSSKDSGTGSDAAVKRSIEDFTLTTLLPAPNAAAQPATFFNRPARASLAKADTDTDTDSDDEDDDDAESAYKEQTLPLGVSAYELERLEPHQRHNDYSPPLLRSPAHSEPYTLPSERERFLQNNNFDGGGTVAAPAPAALLLVCKTNLSTNIGSTQAVDI